MALTVPQQWTTTAGRDDSALKVKPTPDNWLIVTVAYRCVDGTQPLATVGDLARNWWKLLGVASASGGAWRVEVWACPLVRFAPYQLDMVCTAISHIAADDVGSVAIHVAEVAGFVNGFPTATITATAGTASAAGTFSIVMPAPDGGANSFCLAAAAIDDDTKTLSVTSAGWTALTQVSRAGPGLKMAATWRTSTATQTPAWQISSGTTNWCGIVVALAETGTPWAQPNTNWPATKFYMGENVGLETPLPRVAWTDQTSRFEGLNGTRGIQYELNRPQAGEASLTLRDFDDGITPSPGGTYDLYSPCQLLMAWGSPLKIYPVWSGWIEDFPRRWKTPHHAYVEGAAVDAIATLVQKTPTPIRGAVLRMRPYGYWPLSDPSGSTNALNISGRSATILNLQQSKYGVAAAAADFGAATTDPTTGDAGIAGDEGTGWQQEGLLSADTDKGFCLTAVDDNFPAISGGVTICGISNILTGTSQPNVPALTVFIIRNLDPAAGVGLGSVLKLSMLRATNVAQITVWDKDTHVASNSSGASAFTPTAYVAWAVRFTRTAWALSLNGATVLSGSCDLVNNWDQISLGGEADAFANGLCMNATHAHVAVYDRYLSDDEIDAIGFGARFAHHVDEEARQRIQRHLAIAGVSTPRVLDAPTPNSVLLTADMEAGPAAQTTANVASYEDGPLSADGGGYLRFTSKFRGYQQSSRFTLGDDTAGGEIPFKASDRPDYGPTRVNNVIQLINYPSLLAPHTGKAYTSVDADSISRYNPRPLDRETRLYIESDAFGLSNWLLALYHLPAHRWESVTVDATANPSAWPLVLSVECGDLVQVVRRPKGQATISVLCRVMQVQHDLMFGKEQTRGSVTLTLAAAAPAVVVLGDTVKGVLGQATIGW